VLNGDPRIFGGSTPVAEVYDAASGAFAVAGSMSTKREGHDCVCTSAKRLTYLLPNVAGYDGLLLACHQSTLMFYFAYIDGIGEQTH